MINDLYNQLPILSKPYLIIIIVILISIDVGIWKLLNEYRNSKQKENKEPPVITPKK